MPSLASQRTHSLADIQSSNSVHAGLDHDASRTPSAAPSRGAGTMPANKSLGITAASDKRHASSKAAANDENSNSNSDNTESASTAIASQPGNALLQVPKRGNRQASRPIEHSIWDWDSPLESVGESSSYHYEPQGELLHEQRNQHPAKGEYSIPSAVQGSGADWALADTNVAGRYRSSARPRPSWQNTATAGLKRKSTDDQAYSASRQAGKRATLTMSDSGDDVASPLDVESSAQSTTSQGGPTTRSRRGTGSRQEHSIDSQLHNTSRQSDAAESRVPSSDAGASMVLPSRKVFPIQIGDKLFRLSGASISSDAPSYFSQFFEEQLRQNEGADNVRTLYIDRDPATFEDISLHLQGYHVEPRDGPHFVKLFADAQFFSLPRLTAQLFSSTIYIRIGDEEFQIPRDLFNNPGDSPNYFSLGFSVFFTTPGDAFPGLSQRTLLRPPSILPPSIPNKSAKTFADLLHVLKGYPVEVRSEEHRQELLRDARYFHLKGLEQRLIPHQISYNLAREKSEILIRLEDIRQSGISFVGDLSTRATSEAPSPTSTASSALSGPGWIYYQRPYIDAESYMLIVEIGGEEQTLLSVEPPTTTNPNARICRATFHKQTLSRITSLFSVIASKMNLPITQPLGLMMLERGAGVASLPVSPGNTGMSEERVKCRIGPDADVVVDGRAWHISSLDEDENPNTGELEATSAMDVDTAYARAGTKRRRRQQSQEEDEEEESEDEGEEWIVKKAQWRLRVQPVAAGVSGRAGTGMEIVLGAVKIEAFSNERARNALRGFLT